MAGPGNLSARDAFWRCPRCGTPNPKANYLTCCVGCGARPADVPRPEGSAESGAGRADHRGRDALLGRAVSGLSWAYAGVVLLVLVLVWGLGDRWWPATALLLMPRWAWLFPLVGLALATAFVGRRRARPWLVQAATAVVVVGPLMGLNVPWGGITGEQRPGTTLRIMTFNRASTSADPAKIAALVDRERIDLVCFQETERVGVQPGFLPGWEANQDGSIYSRFGIAEELEPSNLSDFPEYGFWPVRHRRARVRLGPGQEILVGSAHMPTPRSGLRMYLSGDRAAAARYLEWRWSQVGELGKVLVETASRPTLFGCDLNTTADSPLLGLLERGYRNAFRIAGWGYGYTKPARWPWAGIDHILVSEHFEVRRCWVGPDLGSDHRPMIAEVVLIGGTQAKAGE